MEVSKLAVPSVYLLICFLSYTSQYLLLYLEPGPLTKNELIRFNVLLICLLISYTRSCFVDPGTIPRPKEDEDADVEGQGQKEIAAEKGKQKGRKWCRKCNAPKPPRAHHCRECGRCIPKMDHHCPWTSNCVSHTTLPHFLRFLLYAVLSLLTLSSLLAPRLAHLWHTRHEPAYLGPTAPQLIHLLLLTAGTFFTLFTLTLLLIRNIWCLASNTTTIEGWEKERHRTLLRRARYFGGVLEGPDGALVPIRKQEFPYDIGVWRNVVQGMNSANPLNWLNPLSPTPTVESGLVFETNGFEDAGSSWPPVDPDRLQRSAYVGKGLGAMGAGAAFTYRDEGLSGRDHVAAFRARQAEDVVRRRKPFLQRMEEQRQGTHTYQEPRARQEVEEDEDAEGFGSDEELSFEEQERDTRVGPDRNRYGTADASGEEAWRNSEGERLRDFGVDEDIEFYDDFENNDDDDDDDDDDDEVPLSELLARRRAAGMTATPAALS